MSQYKPIAIIFLVSITIFYIWMERRKYKNLKELLEYPLQDPIVIKKLNDFADVTKLIEAYTYINNDPTTDMKKIILHIKYLKETEGKSQGFEDASKLVTSTIPLTAILVTISIALFKDSKMLVGFGQITIDFIELLLISFVFITLHSFINSVSFSKTNILISKHLLIAEEIHKEVATVKSSDVINNPHNTGSD